MARILYLVDDDEPGRFSLSTATVVQPAVRIGNRTGIGVRIDPPVESAARGALHLAVLVPRSAASPIDPIAHGPLDGSVAVFVYRMRNSREGVPPVMEAADLEVSFWGRVGESAQSVRFGVHQTQPSG